MTTPSREDIGDFNATGVIDEELPGLPKFFHTEPGNEPTYSVPERQAYTLNSFREHNQFVDKEPYHFEISEYKPVITTSQLKKFFKSTIPILVWLREYRWKQDIFADVIGGITLGVLRIPQAMAYSLLANVPPVYGLYTCFFSCIIYTVLGSSRHVSVGAFSVLCLMMGTVITNHFPEYVEKSPHQSQHIVSDLAHKDETLSEVHGQEIELLTAMCFVVGIMQVLLGFFKLGALSILMSETLVSGFTTGAACQVFTSQLPLLLGVNITTSGKFAIVFKVYYEIFDNISDTNYITALISGIALFLMIFTTYYDIGNFKKKTGMPLPMELSIVIIITTVSYLIKLHALHEVEIVGLIPNGLPEPTLPNFHVMPSIITESIPIAIVSYVISFSMALLFAKKYKYRVHANQELFALGFSNIFCSFFCCYPVSVALGRTLVKEKAGCKTQLASFISCGMILAVLLFLGPLFEALPKCILGAIVIAAVQGMFFQIRDLILAWQMSILDALVWLVSFFSVLVFNIMYGLLISISFSLLTIILRTINIRAFKIQFTEPQACLLGVLPKTDIYVDTSKYQRAKEIPGIKIFRFNGPIHFANRKYFTCRLHDLIDVTTKLALEARSRRITVHHKDLVEKTQMIKPSVYFSGLVRFIILDCSGCPYIDLSGLSTLLEMIKDYAEEDVSVHFAACQDPVLDTLKHTKFETKAPTSCIFPTIHDAVLYCVMARNEMMP